MLLTLAEFHQQKMLAAIGVSYFEQLGDASRIAEAAGHMALARDRWHKLVELGKPYHAHLMFISGDKCVRKGTWADFNEELDLDCAQIAALAAENPCAKQAPILRGADASPVFSDDLPAEHPAGKPLTVNVCGGVDLTQPLRMRVRRTNQLELAFRAYPMERTDGGWCGIIPSEEFMDEWDTMVYFDTFSENGDGIVYPGLRSEAHHTPYKVIRVV